MAIGEICNREVIVAHRETTILEASRLMRQHHVGDLVIVDESSGKRVPAGIVTDRDIVLEVISMDLDASVLTVGDIMGTSLVVAHERDGIFEAIRCMRAKGIRRLPVVDDDQTLTGIVTLDDLLELLAGEMNELAQLIPKEKGDEVRLRSSPIPH